MTGTDDTPVRPSRRTLLSGLAGLGGLAGGGLIGHKVTEERTRAREEELTGLIEPARRSATHKDGLPPALSLPTPAHIHVLALDVTGEDASTVRNNAEHVLQTLGEEIDALHEEGVDARAPGTAAQDLHPASLGITLGLGAELFQRGELQDRLPDHMEPLPDSDTDHLVAEWCDGDLMLHVAAEDPVVVSTAAGHLLSLVRDHARVRWSLPGFQRSTVAAEDPDATPRNLMGQIDGTVNPHPSEAMFDVQVLATHSEPGREWMDGGTYVVIRRIRMLLDDWFTLEPEEREEAVGRRLPDGAPLGGRYEGDLPDFSARGPDGNPVIAENAHIRLAGPENTLGARMLRRGFSYDLGWDHDGNRQAGLLFTAWQADPRTGFVPVQQALDEGGDALNAYIRHEGSALFAVPANHKARLAPFRDQK